MHLSFHIEHVFLFKMHEQTTSIMCQKMDFCVSPKSLPVKQKLKNVCGWFRQKKAWMRSTYYLPFSFLKMFLPNFFLFKNAIHYATHENEVAIYDDRMKLSFFQQKKKFTKNTSRSHRLRNCAYHIIIVKYR